MKFYIVEIFWLGAMAASPHLLALREDQTPEGFQEDFAKVNEAVDAASEGHYTTEDVLRGMRDLGYNFEASEVIEVNLEP